MEESEILRQAASGKTEAFEELVRQYEKPVYNLALRMVRNPEDAQDLAQEAFLRAWRGLGQFQFESAFSTWLYRLTSNVCIDFLRRQKKQVQSSLTVCDEEEQARELSVPDPAPLPEERAIANEQRALVRQAMDQLETEHRQILTLRVIQGLSYQEIGQILELKEGTVKSRLARAREKIRQQLERNGNLFAGDSSKESRKGAEA